MKRSFLLLLAIHCAAAKPAPVVPTQPTQPPPIQAVATPRAESFDEGLRAQGLVPIQLKRTRRGITFAMPEGPKLDAGHITIVEAAGYHPFPTVFAQRPDGSIVRVIPNRTVVVDRHVPGGCLRFAGGRGWFETVEYDLPSGATYGGDVTVEYNEHTEVTDYSDTEPDGTPCGPPAID